MQTRDTFVIERVQRRRAQAALLVIASATSLSCEVLAPPAPKPKPPKPGYVVSRPFPEIRTLTDVEVVAADATHITRAFAVGSDGTILRYDGATWTPESIADGPDLESISAFVDGEGTETILAVGENGTVIKRGDDGVWALIEAPPPPVFADEDGDNAPDYLDPEPNNAQVPIGVRPPDPPAPITNHLFGVWVAAADDAFIVGERGTVLRYDGEKLTSLAEEILIQTEFGGGGGGGGGGEGEGEPAGPVTDIFPISDNLKSIQGRSATDVWTVGARGSIYHFDGDRFFRDDSGTNRALSHVFVEGGLFAAATDGVLLHRTDAWSDQDFIAPSPIFLQGIWGRNESDLFAVGLGENMFHNENGIWDITFIEEEAALRAIDGLERPRPEDAADDFVTEREFIAVGAGGRIVRGPIELAHPDETLLTTRLAPVPEEE